MPGVRQGDGKTDGGGTIINLSQADGKVTNFRVLQDVNRISDAPKVSFIIPAEQPLEILFFRLMFTKLRDQLHRDKLEDGDPDNDDEEEDICAEIIPVDVFQRAMERIMYVLQAPGEGFDARNFDVNDSGLVGWTEFCYVYQDHKPKIIVSMCERVFLTFERQDTSALAGYVSAAMLLTIAVSSMCMVLSSVRFFQDTPTGNNEPKPKAFFSVIENTCLAIFCVDYVVRVGTCWAVRTEVFNQEKLLDLAVGYETIELPSSLERFVRFVLKPACLVDLLAIAPSIVEMAAASGEGGGGGGIFLVLRLVRLTRILRVFKSPKIKEPVIVLERTLKESTRALYVLGFNLGLGIVVFGSLLYAVEGGTWNPDTNTFQRLEWDGAIHDYTRVDSPFKNIPHTFWWAFVTATTVGYGDLFPVKGLGYLVAASLMLFSLVILALPVGVIGGTFSKVWEEYDEQKKSLEANLREENIKVTKAFEKINPVYLSNQMLIEVWNQRFYKRPLREGQLRPHRAEFLGQVKITLDNRSGYKIHHHTLPLQANADIVARPVKGTLSFEYEWTPEPVSPDCSPMNDLDESNEVKKTTSRRRTSDVEAALKGSLRYRLKAGTDLLNLNLHSASNPFVLVFCYPDAPDADQSALLMPCVWRSPTVEKNVNPKWDVEHTFHYDWTTPGKSSSRVLDMSLRRFPEEKTEFDFAMDIMELLSKEIVEVDTEVKAISKRVDKAQDGQALPKAL